MIENVDIERLMKISKFDLSPAELDEFKVWLDGMLEFITELKNRSLDEDVTRSKESGAVFINAHDLNLNDLRKDISGNSLEIEKVLQNAPRKNGRSFAVPIVVE